jgi:hypothetical protein
MSLKERFTDRVVLDEASALQSSCLKHPTRGCYRSFSAVRMTNEFYELRRSIVSVAVASETQNVGTSGPIL